MNFSSSLPSVRDKKRENVITFLPAPCKALYPERAGGSSDTDRASLSICLFCEKKLIRQPPVGMTHAACLSVPGKLSTPLKSRSRLARRVSGKIRWRIRCAVRWCEPVLSVAGPGVAGRLETVKSLMKLFWVLQYISDSDPPVVEEIFLLNMTHLISW